MEIGEPGGNPQRSPSQACVSWPCLIASGEGGGGFKEQTDGRYQTSGS